MPPTADDRLRDILEAITQIEDILRGADFHRFGTDLVTRLATERLLEVICEASRSIPTELKQATPTIDWRKLIDFGNVLRHAYHTTDAEIVWDIVQNDLPPLKASVEKLIRLSGR
jgi:uncharacterized protein with HEPN domain